MFRVLKFSALAVAALLLAAPAFGTTVSYNTLSAFQAATSGLTVINFDSDTPNVVVGAGDGTAFSLDGVTFNVHVNIGPSTSPTFGNVEVANHYATTSGTQYLGTDDPGSPNDFYGTDDIRVTLGSAVTAFGLYVLADAPAGTFTLDTGVGTAVNGNNATAVTLSDGSLAYFIGITSDTAFTSVFIHGNGSDPDSGPLWNVDDLQYGTANTSTPPPAVPEPASLLLIGTGLAGVVRRFRKA